MANPFASAWKSFWHTMTSRDRHASHDSPYRTGQHIAVSQSRHAPLTSVATSAVDSHPDLSATYSGGSNRPSVSSPQNPSSPVPGQSPSRPYAPGMRSSMSSPKKPDVTEITEVGEIPMQNFADGAPPPPPVSHSWKKIDRWTENKYEELFDQLGEGCTQNDINELEHELDISLPQDVRESLSVHDGQERGGRPTGIILGCMLMDCEEIVQEWKNWRIVNEEFLNGQTAQRPEYPLKALNQPSSSHQSAQANKKLWRQELLDKQESQPPGAIQRAYASRSWIPLVRDWGGNNIAIDLDPGPAGKWGQVILFGRDYDCKYVVARSWAHFLGVVAEDLCSEKVIVDEESGELRLREFKTENVEPAYMDILRWRADQKFGRRGPKRKPQPPPGLNTHVNGVNGRSSPYSSPVMSNEDRGRSQQRFSRGANGSPRGTVGSPLARVQEEGGTANGSPARQGGDVVKDFANDSNASRRVDKLVDAPTPIDIKAPSLNKNKLVDAPTPIESKPINKNKLVDVPSPTLSRVSTMDEKRSFPTSNLSRSTTMEMNDHRQRDEEAVVDDDKENEDRQQRHQHQSTKGLGVNGIEDEMTNVAI